ncbi:hypothetical protein BDW22DRAFT_1358008 [Trametopsis cervina]|nr:hypothetical protein BDW22DRAFT_1358008 [Trametopsis cervina]
MHTRPPCSAAKRTLGNSPVLPSTQVQTSPAPISAKTPTSKFMSAILLVIGRLCFSIQWLYDYVGLFGLHLFYFSSMSNAPDRGNHRRRPHDAWISLIDDLSKRGHHTLFVAAMCTMANTFVVQYSPQAVPQMFGLISIVFALDNVVTSAPLLSLVPLMKTESAARVFLDRPDHRALMRAARLFAVPLSSSIWCMLTTVASLMSYCTQTGAAPMDLPFDEEGHLGSSQTHLAPTPVARQHLQGWSIIIIAFVGIISFLHFIHTIYSIIRLRQDI